jgi:membrane-associated protease RseP (regulator of RpoE activity)
MNGEAARARKTWLHVALFLATFVTTTIAGAWQNGLDLSFLLSRPSEIASGLPFSCTLMSILLVHEMGHYLMSRRYGVEATLPYFIPGPSFVGTFGAFIRMQSRMPDRKSLFDIGAAGPIAGLVLSIVAVLVGLQLEAPPSRPDVTFYSSYLFSFLVKLGLGSIPAGEFEIHPVATAGWFGLFVTAINLLPAGQLDGGHVSYALFGRMHVWVSRLTVIVLFFFGFIGGWVGWIFWGVLILALTGVRHPPPADPETPLDPKRKVIGWLLLATLAVTFTPVPFTFNEPEIREERPRPPRGREGLQRTAGREVVHERAIELAPIFSHHHAPGGRALHL